MLRQNADATVRVFVVWEPVIKSDIEPPTSPVLALLPDVRVVQFWDPTHAISSALRPGADFKRPLWDWVAVFPPAVTWEREAPQASFAGGDVVDVIDKVQSALASPGH